MENTGGGTLPRVVSGFKPVILRATSMGSTFARLEIYTEMNIRNE